MKINLNQRLYLVNNLEIVLTAALTCLFIYCYLQYSTYFTIFLLPSVCMLLYALAIMKQHIKKSNNLIYSPYFIYFYRKVFNKWVDTYVFSRQSLIEKKYALAFLLIWLKVQKFDIYDIKYILKDRYILIINLSKEIYLSGMSTYYSLAYLTYYKAGMHLLIVVFPERSFS